MNNRKEYLHLQRTRRNILKFAARIEKAMERCKRSKVVVIHSVPCPSGYEIEFDNKDYQYIPVVK